MLLASFVRQDERDDLVDRVLGLRQLLLEVTVNAVGPRHRYLLTTAPSGSMAAHAVCASNHPGNLPDASEFG